MCDLCNCFGVYGGVIVCCVSPFWDGEKVTPSKVVGDLQLRDKKVTSLNHLVFFFYTVVKVDGATRKRWA